MSTPNIILIKRRLADSPLGTSTISLSVGEFAYNEVNHTLYIGTSSLGTLDVAGPGSYTRLSLTNTLTSGLQNQINTLSIGTSTELQPISSVLNTKIDTVSSTLTTDVNALSSNLNNLRIYTDSSFLPLSGGTVTGKVYIHDNLTIYGNVSATGNSYFSNTIYSTTSALSVVNLGNNGPAMWIGNNGTGDIASFYDIDQNVEVLHVGGSNGFFPNVGVKTSQPNKDFTVNGEISANNTIWDSKGNSNQWNSVYSSTSNTSASWDSVYNAVQSNSATTWNYQGTDLKSLSSNWQNVYTTVSSNSANWNYQGTDIKSLTGSWDSVYSTVNSNSATNWNYQGTDLKSLSSNWQSTFSTVSSLSSNWNYQGTDLKALSGNWQSTFSTVSSLSSNWSSVYTTTQTNSANWQTAYAYVSANSANLTATNIFVNNNLTVTNTVSAKYYQGTLLDWMTLVRGYKTTPTLLATIGTGEVYTYVFATTGTDKTYYRYIATDGSEDSFYGNFTNPTLSNLIARKAIIL